MEQKDLSGFSDQRYYHIALLRPRGVKGATPASVWRTIARDAELGDARLQPSSGSGWADLRFRTVVESEVFAGSEIARNALAVKGRGHRRCAYDVFVGQLAASKPNAPSIVALGTGFGSLSDLILSRLKERKLIESAYLGKPRLDGIAEHVRRRPKSVSNSVEFTTAGLSIFSGVKAVQWFRLSGRDLYESPLVDTIQAWSLETGRQEEEKKPTPPSLKRKLFHLLALRLRCESDRVTDHVSITLRKDGGLSFWLRKGCAGMSTLGLALGQLDTEGFFEDTTDWPQFRIDTDASI